MSKGLYYLPNISYLRSRNAGFDPAVIRVDTYGNVLYYHADSASPLAWEIDHWFPCSSTYFPFLSYFITLFLWLHLLRCNGFVGGGLTVPSNLRILQWQACKKKHNKLEFLVPWWDLQLGVSINQFLSVFASTNSDFRHRAFSFLFKEGEYEELNDSQTVDSHCFPQHFVESKKQLGLAPAAIVVSRRDPYDPSSALKSLDCNRQIRPHSPVIAARKAKPSALKENENPDFFTNPYQAIVMARDSLKQREEAQRMQTEIQKLDEDVNEMRRKNDEEKVTIQDLEMKLIKHRRRVEKCRKLSEAQSSYRTVLEKMIRDAMHQSVVYKEQVRLNQAASSALMARLEAQKAICDASEKELHKKFKQRDELEKQIRPEWEEARKRSRLDYSLLEERENKAILHLPGIRPRMPLHKELRVFLDEEYKASEAGLSLDKDQRPQEIEGTLQNPAKHIAKEKFDEPDKSIIALVDENSIEDNLQRLEIREGKRHSIQLSALQESEIEEDEESRRQRGKGNVERWLQLLLENSQEEVDTQAQDKIEASKSEVMNKLNPKYPQMEKQNASSESSKIVQEKDHGKRMEREVDTQVQNEIEASKSDEIVKKLDSKYPQMEKQNATHLQEENRKIVQEKDHGKRMEEIFPTQHSKTPRQDDNSCEMETKERKNKNRKERVLVRSKSARALRRIPSSPSLILKKGVDFIRKKPTVVGDDGEDQAVGNNFIRSSIKLIKKAVK
ncbi:early endosome antigen 1 isoform X1 [Carica papaya]|uniref:early endosome antigen 1 isoform X1 n=1 Tax=Carica papaya TaxID=3649 RepID=UPI000B8CAB9C|nr:early endosome antigen 1 isoform X1 [Carica papaya]